MVRYPVKHMPNVSYADIAFRVQDMRQQGVSVEEVLAILAKPLIGIYLERSGSNA